MYNKKCFQNQLKSLRMDSHLTQKKLADNLGISQNTYSGYEIGTHEPDIGMLVKIADNYDCSIDWLIGRRFVPYCNNNL